MLISVRELVTFWGLNPKGVLHVGAHEAEEKLEYDKYGWGPTTWVEAQPEKASELRKLLGGTNDLVLEAAVWSKSKIKLELKISNNTQSTSLLDFGTHSSEYPEIVVSRIIPVETKRLDEILPGDFCPEFISFDIQGAELEALIGYGEKIHSAKWIYLEVNQKPLYKGCATVDQIDEYLSEKKFRRVATRWTPNGWGDALYCSNDLKVEGLNKILWNLKQISWNGYQGIGRGKRRLKNFLKRASCNRNLFAISSNCQEGDIVTE